MSTYKIVEWLTDALMDVYVGRKPSWDSVAEMFDSIVKFTTFADLEDSARTDVPQDLMVYSKPVPIQGNPLISIELDTRPNALIGNLDVSLTVTILVPGDTPCSLCLIKGRLADGTFRVDRQYMGELTDFPAVPAQSSTGTSAKSMTSF